MVFYISVSASIDIQDEKLVIHENIYKVWTKMTLDIYF